MKPVLDPETGTERTRRQSCLCGHEFQQTLILVDGYTDLGGPVEKAREVWVPMACGTCSRAKNRAAAHASDPRLGVSR